LQEQQETQNQAIVPADKKSKIPAHAVIKSHVRAGNGASNYYTYQLKNAAGKKLKGSGYATEEHIQELVAVGNVQVRHNTSQGRFVPSPHGKIIDRVGLSAPLPSGDYYFQIVSQTFTVSYQGHDYDLTTRFVHITKAADGSVPEADVGVVVP